MSETINGHNKHTDPQATNPDVSLNEINFDIGLYLNEHNINYICICMVGFN